MRTDPSDAQVARHTFGQMAENLGILRDALKDNGFEGSLRDQLVIEWWKTVVMPQPPDLTELMNTLLKGGE